RLLLKGMPNRPIWNLYPMPGSVVQRPRRRAGGCISAFAVKSTRKRADNQTSRIMPATEVINENLIRENITRAITDVFKTMLGQVPVLAKSTEHAAEEPWPPLHANLEAAKPHVVGTVGFI